MIREYRYQGVTRDTNKVVRGTFYAKSKSSGQKEVQRLAAEHNFLIQKIEPKKSFFYRALTPSGNKIKGEQEAYHKEELYHALSRLGYRNIKIEPVLLDFMMKPPFQVIVMFISLTADMLRENMKYDEILKILVMDTQNRTLKNTLKNISRDLRQGQDGMSVFQKYTDVFGKFAAYMLGLASKSGNMADIYEHTAKYLTRQVEFKKNVRSALVMPSITILAIIGTVIYYVGVLFPDLIKMFIRFKMELPPMTAATYDLSQFLQANWWWLMLLFMLPVLGVYLYWRTEKGRLDRDRFILRIPIIGSLIHKMSIEIFFRVFSVIYSGSGNNIEVLQISAEATNNRYMEKQIKEITIPMMLKDGAGLVDAMDASGVFTETAISRLNSGAASGSVKRAAGQIAAYYEKETGYKFKALLQTIETFTALFIMVVMTGLVVVSSETAFIRPKPPGM